MIARRVNKETCVAAHKLTGNVKPMTIADNLRRLRTAAGLSQAGLAAKSGVSQQLISQIERGVNLSTKALPALAVAIGCGVADIDPTYDVDASLGAREIPVLTLSDAAELPAMGHKTSWLAAFRKTTVGDLPSGDWIAVLAEDESIDRVAPSGALMIVNTGDVALSAGRFYLFVDPEFGLTFPRRYHDDPELLEPVSTSARFRPVALKPPIFVLGRIARVITSI